MTDFASLGIKIDSSQAVKAASDLDKLAAVGDRVAQSIADAATANAKFQKSASDAAKASKANSDSIDKTVQGLQKVAAANSLSAREAKLYDLALQGATKSQLQAADAAIRLDEGYKRGVATGQKIREGFISTAAAALKLGAALGAAAVGGKVLFDKIADGIAKYQELSEKTGETASNIASLQPASDASGVSLDTVATASIRLTSALSKTDDESKLVAKGIRALGLNFDEFKRLSPVQQLDAVAKSMSGFANGAEKTATAVAIFGKSGAELIPFFNDLADAGERQIRLTDDQIKAADDYTKAQAKLKGEISALAQVVVAESIPAVTDLTGALKDAITEVVGMGGAATDLKNNNAIGAFADDGARFLANLIDMGDKVVFMFQYVGKSIAAAAAIASQAAQGNFAGAGAILDAAREDGQKLLNRPSVADALDKRIAERNANAARARQENRGFDPGKPRINAGGLNTDKAKKGKTDNSAAQEAKAQLAFDLEDIRKAQDALTNTIANGEKILEAKRSANLVTEEAYWQSKKDFLIANNQAEQDGLEKQLARLQQEKLTGKDAIDNSRKILDAEAKLNKARQDGATNVKVLEIRQTDALDKVAAKWELAEKAAQSYVDTIARQNDRDIAGLGKGNLNREIDSRKNQRDDQFQGRRDQLYSQFRDGFLSEPDYNRNLAIESTAHAKALAADEKYWKEKLAKQKEWSVGASEAFQNFIDEANNVAATTEKIVTSGLGGLSDSITAAIMGDGGKSFTELGKSLGTQIIKGLVDSQIVKPLAQLAQDALKSIGGGGLGSVLGAATGGAGSTASTAALGSSALGASAAITTLAAAATAAAAAMGGSSLSSALGLANSVGSTGGDSLGSLISSMGWADGGYTGEGTKFQPAGIVHAGEYVVNAENTRRLGLGFLERLNKRGYAEGGFVGNVMGGNLGPASGGGDSNTTVHISNHFAAGTSAQTMDQAAQKMARVLQKSGRNA